MKERCEGGNSQEEPGKQDFPNFKEVSEGNTYPLPLDDDLRSAAHHSISRLNELVKCEKPDVVWVKWKNKSSAEESGRLSIANGTSIAGVGILEERGLYTSVKLGSLFPHRLHDLILDLNACVDEHFPVPLELMGQVQQYAEYFSSKRFLRITTRIEQDFRSSLQEIACQTVLQEAHSQFRNVLALVLRDAVLEIDEDLNLFLNKQQLKARHKTKWLFQVFIRHYPRIENKNFCKDYDSRAAEFSKESDAYIRRIHRVIPTLNAPSKKGVREVSGVRVEFRGNQERIMAKIIEGIRRRF